MSKIARILVSQPKPSIENSPYELLQRRTGVELTFRPFIHVEGVSAFDFRKQRVDLAKFGAAILITRTATEHFFRICQEMRYEVPDTFRYYCMDERIANYLQKFTVYRKRRVYFAPTGANEELITLAMKSKDARLIMPISNVHKNDLHALLRKAQLRVTKSIMYRSVSSDMTDLDLHTFDMLAFFSPLGIQSLQDNFPDFEQGDIRIAALGKSTQYAARKAGLRLDVTVPSARWKSMAEALEDYIQSENAAG